MNEMNQQQQLMNRSQNLMSLNQLNPHQPQPPQMLPMNRSYGMWAPPPPQFQNPNPSAGGSIKLPPPSGFTKALGPRSNWKGKKVNNTDKRRKDQPKSAMLGVASSSVVNPSYNSYQPPLLNELQHQNRLKTRKFFPKKKFNKNNNNAMNVNTNVSGNVKYFKNSRSAPFAPRNTSSFLIRAKKSGGIASLVSPCPVTPAVLPTPIFSPSREVLVDMAKEEWGVDGYGSMKGLIRLRSPGHEMEPNEDEEEDEGGSSESDVEEHVEVERRLDHDLSRFEMIYDPVSGTAGGMEYHNVLENRVDDQDSHIAQLEEENLILKERLFLMERELGDLRRRMQCLERGNRGEEFNEEVVENDSENDTGSREEAHSMEDNTGDFSEDNVQGDGYGCSKVEGGDGDNGEGLKAAMAIEKGLVSDIEGKLENNDNVLIVANKDCNLSDVEVKEENNNDQVTGLDKNENNNEGTEASKTEETVTVVKEVEGKLEVEGNVDDRSFNLADVQMEEGGTADDKLAPEN